MKFSPQHVDVILELLGVLRHSSKSFLDHFATRRDLGHPAGLGCACRADSAAEWIAAVPRVIVLVTLGHRRPTAASMRGMGAPRNRQPWPSPSGEVTSMLRLRRRSGRLNRRLTATRLILCTVTGATLAPSRIAGIDRCGINWRLDRILPKRKSAPCNFRSRALEIGQPCLIGDKVDATIGERHLPPGPAPAGQASAGRHLRIVQRRRGGIAIAVLLQGRLPLVRGPTILVRAAAWQRRRVHRGPSRTGHLDFLPPSRDAAVIAIRETWADRGLWSACVHPVQTCNLRSARRVLRGCREGRNEGGLEGSHRTGSRDRLVPRQSRYQRAHLPAHVPLRVPAPSRARPAAR
mmetsp:Transcript_29980/g.78980  ORF Transcript_29980/g.78980 Transcript_29980/m.78980 type:complete len:349 (-) Transcript_29980:147-1193(-)